MSAPKVLRHLYLEGITPFKHASTLQSTLVSQFLSHKALTSSATPPAPLPPAPTPTLLTFVPTPVYTTGRRELGTLTQGQIALLKQPLRDIGDTQAHGSKEQIAEVEETLRGGQITFHGPGQLVIYPILDLKSIRNAKWPKGLSVRCYVNLLEETTIRTLCHFQLQAIRTEHPGVWVDETTKVAALGVHLRRNITSYGVGLNYTTDLRWFDRIVACGLEGKQTTSVQAETLNMLKASGLDPSQARANLPTIEDLSRKWAAHLADGLFGESQPPLLQDITEAQLLHGD